MDQEQEDATHLQIQPLLTVLCTFLREYLVLRLPRSVLYVETPRNLMGMEASAYLLIQIASKTI